MNAQRERDFRRAMAFYAAHECVSILSSLMLKQQQTLTFRVPDEQRFDTIKWDDAVRVLGEIIEERRKRDAEQDPAHHAR